MVIEIDTRNKKDSYLTEYLDKKGIKWIRNKLYSGDVKLLNSTDVVIDLKKDLLEICGNLTRLSEHERVKREIAKAKEIGCKRFIFLINEKKIKTIDDVSNWSSSRTKVKGEILMKIMKTMSEKYEVEFIFTTKEKAGEKILNLLGGIDYDLSKINF